jgi:hypothetical protein
MNAARSERIRDVIKRKIMMLKEGLELTSKT